MSLKASSTIGFERRFNPALALADELAFVTETAAVGAPKPPNMARLVELNRGPFVPATPAIEELGEVPRGASLLDVRPIGDFLAGHRPGAVNVPVDGGSFATKAGFVLELGTPVVVGAGSAAEAQRALRGLNSVGVLDVAGSIDGAGPERMEPVGLDELEALLAAGAELIDVRERDERDGGYIAGSRNIPYRLLSVAGADVPADRPVVTICESGARAGIAASLLSARGLDARPVLGGGVDAWADHGGRTVEFRRCGN
jgi:hydroxyacylglutathione hydrolase